jgi:hypothetical protein
MELLEGTGAEFVQKLWNLRETLERAYGMQGRKVGSRKQLVRLWTTDTVSQRKGNGGGDK